MNKKGLKLALTALLAVSQAFALSEVRTPWIAGNGPLRYMFEKYDENEKYALNLWSAAHAKYANRAFTKNGFKTKEISELIFNKSEFSLGEAAFNGAGDPSGDDYNPLADAKTVAPRVDYSEMGMTLGGEISMPIGRSGKGRLGIRGSVPFRSIEMDRLDSGLDKAEDAAKDYVAVKVIRVNQPNNGGENTAVARGPAVLAKAYRLDMVAKLPGVSGAYVLDAPATGGMTLFGTQLGDVNLTAGQVGTNTVAIAASKAGSSNPVLPAAYGYSLSTGGNAVNNTNLDFSVYHDTQAAHASNDGKVVVLAADLNNLTTAAKNINSINSGHDYSAAFAAGSPADYKNNWLIFRRSSNSGDPEKYTNGVDAGSGRGLVAGLDQVISQYTQNAFAYLAQNDYSLDSQNRIGIGDIDLDVFYDHQLHEDWNAEAFVGLRLPTGDSKDKFGTPYRALLGNGEHFEVKLGGMLAWQPLTWMNVKADASYSFVLESKENRMAVFAGSTVKNMGPKAPADVDWGYFKGHFDMNFFHPKTSDIRSTLGYEFYYKAQDNVSFKSSTATAFDGSTHALDNKLAEANTESMAHKVRFETSYQLSQYLELFCGGSFTFAGQNVMRDADTHGGFNVRF